MNACARIHEVSRLPIFVSVAGYLTIANAFPHADVMEHTSGKFSFGLRHYAPAPALPPSALALLAQHGITILDNPEFFTEP